MQSSAKHENLYIFHLIPQVYFVVVVVVTVVNDIVSEPDKTYQLVDWRVRPLSEDHLKYARGDTHFLLYIKDVLRNDLLKKANGKSNILRAVYKESTEVCKIRYEKPVWHKDSYVPMYRKSQKMFNNKQLYALKELHRWRDVTAREVDDSLYYVMPDHVMINIAQTLPKEMQGILACCSQIPPLVRQNCLQLHKIVLRAIGQPLIKPVLEEEERQRMAQRNLAVNNEQEIWNYSPHDIPSDVEFRAGLPCLLVHGKRAIRATKVKPAVTVWGSLEVVYYMYIEALMSHHYILTSVTSLFVMF